MRNYLYRVLSIDRPVLALLHYYYCCYRIGFPQKKAHYFVKPHCLSRFLVIVRMSEEEGEVAAPYKEIGAAAT